MESNLSSGLILALIFGYFLVLMGVSWWTGRGAKHEDFFLAGRKAPWYLVAFGMVGASLSGVTFISIPGVVGAGGANMAFSYMQMVFGYLLGYVVIATVLMPVYYRMNLTSIYGYLEERFGFWSYKTGAAFFLLSRTIGASFRLYLVALVLDPFVPGPFWLTVAVAIGLIWVYTFRGGIKTIVWTDTLQTTCMLGAVILTVLAIGNSMDLGVGGLISEVRNSDYSQLFFFDGGWSDPNNFFKQFISGALIAIVMTGLDQDMMQKNLACKSLKDAQKNMFWFSIILVIANVLFLSLGALLYLFAAENGLAIPEKTDQLFGMIALEHLPPIVGLLFVLGLIAAAYSSADSALTSLTTAFCVDFLNFEKNAVPEHAVIEDASVLDALPGNSTAEQQKRTRFLVHLSFSFLLFLVIILFYQINDDAVISKLFVAAGYTYGPLLGLYAFGLFTNRNVRDNWVLSICLAAPVLSYIINLNAATWFNGLSLGFLILAVNGGLTFLGVLAISSSRTE
ncbi:MAG: sodium:solute symporter [Bacteroidota bacterium]